MLSCSLCQILTLPSECRSRNQDSSDQATFFQTSSVQWHPVWSSAAVAHLLQGSTCCAFRDGILYTLVVMSGYLSSCCLSIISNQSAHSPLTSDLWHQQGIFVHTTAAHWIFSLFRTLLCQTTRWLGVKIPVDQQFLKYSDQPVWHQQHWMFKVT